MANTYTQIHIQCVMAVKFRQSLIQKEWKERLHKYITGIVQNHGHKMISINSMPDHLHMFWIETQSVYRRSDENCKKRIFCMD
jgi:putative transposase